MKQYSRSRTVLRAVQAFRGREAMPSLSGKQSLLTGILWTTVVTIPKGSQGLALCRTHQAEVLYGKNDARTADCRAGEGCRIKTGFGGSQRYRSSFAQCSAGANPRS